MPKDNIERAIKRGAGATDGQDFTEVMYEGYGAGGVAILCDALTDNRNRTAGELRKTFEVHGGNLGGAGCVGWMFERKGVFVIAKADATEERLFEVTLEAGADDVKDLRRNVRGDLPGGCLPGRGGRSRSGGDQHPVG